LRQHIASGGSGLEDEDWEHASQAAHRMQQMINEVVTVIQSDAFGEEEEVGVDELFTDLRKRIGDRAREKGVQIEISEASGVYLEERKSRIALLILENLANNGIDACESAGELSVHCDEVDSNISFIVEDSGRGFSERATENLFQPVQSSKSQGAGIGLAISQQLARHIGGRLDLISSSSEGTRMKLTICS